jgi:hypothetical protein
MAWRLPIVASDWRGNRDVLTPHAGAICFPISGSFVENLIAALKQAIQERADWKEWGKVNRCIFEQAYCDSDCEKWLAEPLLAFVN